MGLKQKKRLYGHASLAGSHYKTRWCASFIMCFGIVVLK